MLHFDKDLQGEAKRTETSGIGTVQVRGRGEGGRGGEDGERANERENGGVRKRVKVSRDNCPTLKRLAMLNNVLEPCLVLVARLPPPRSFL